MSEQLVEQWGFESVTWKSFDVKCFWHSKRHDTSWFPCAFYIPCPWFVVIIFAVELEIKPRASENVSCCSGNDVSPLSVTFMSKWKRLERTWCREKTGEGPAGTTPFSYHRWAICRVNCGPLSSFTLVSSEQLCRQYVRPLTLQYWSPSGGEREVTANLALCLEETDEVASQRGACPTYLRFINAVSVWTSLESVFRASVHIISFIWRS